MRIENGISKLISLVKRNGHPMLLSQLAKETGINYHTLRKAALDGRLDAEKQGRFWLSTIADVREAIRDRKIEGGER